MSKLASLIRQTEIIKLAKRRPFDWETLDRHLMRKEEELERALRISKRTLNRDLMEIASLFGITISYDFKSNQYQLDAASSSEENTHLLEAFDMLQVFGRKGKSLAISYLNPDLRKARSISLPSSMPFKHGKLIRIEYGKFWKWETEHRILKPLALKEFKQRWYLLAYDEHDRFKVFGLDRIRELDTLMEKFRPKGAMDFESYFRNVIGIINDPNEPVETVILTFTEFKGRYIQSMPLHPTQEVLVNDGKVLQISFRVKINYELISEILSHGDEVRVDAPERLREMVREKAGKIFRSKLC